MLHHYKENLVNAIWGDYVFLFWESYKTKKYILWTAQLLNDKAGSTYGLNQLLNY